MLNPPLFIFINKHTVGILLKHDKAELRDQSLNSLLPRPKPRWPEIKGSCFGAKADALRENSATDPLARLDDLAGSFQPLKLPSYGKT